MERRHKLPEELLDAPVKVRLKCARRRYLYVHLHKILVLVTGARPVSIVGEVRVRYSLPAVANKTVAPFTAGQLEALCRELGEAMTGSQIDRLLPAAQVRDTSQQSTKWKRLYESLGQQQNAEGNGKAVCRFIKVAMAPERFGSEPERYESHRGELNLTLGFVGLELRENGKLYPAKPTTTLTEAQERANALKAKLRDRNVHPDVLTFCRAELVQKNYFHAVFEATKSVAEKIRTKTGLKSDGAQLCDDAFGIKGGMPALAFNLLQNPTEESEHKGLAMLVKGTFGTFRNTTAHAPKVSWPIELEDALDLLTLVSMLHRRLDTAHVTPAAPINQI